MKNEKRILLPIFTVICIVCLLCVFLVWKWYGLELARLEALSSPRTDIEATRTVGATLTELYGEEVKDAIENFEIRWYGVASLDATEDLSDVATGLYLEEYGRPDQLIRQQDPTSVWQVVTSAQVKWVRVVEYTSERFKAVAATDWVYDRMTPQKEVIHSDMETQHCGVYVFVRKDGMWKLEGLFNTTRLTQESLMYQWENVPAWLKEIIGELPSGGLCRQ